jgi:Galactose oxidase, central domain
MFGTAAWVDFYKEAEMTRMNTQKVARILTITLSGVLAVGQALATPAPALGQASGTFTFTGSMHTARAFHTATLLQNGQVLVAGGFQRLCSVVGACSNTLLAAAELYNPATGQWTVTGSMSTARYEHTATLLANGEVLVTGGLAEGAEGTMSLASAELYNPSTGKWSATGSMTVARTLPGAALLKNGEVLVAGGSTYSVCGTGCTSDEPIAAAELYNPSTGTFTATASMNLARDNTQLTLLQNGQALIVGNCGSAAPGDGDGCTSELFSNGHWSLTNLAFCGVTGNTAALLPNGDVVIDVGSLGQFYDPSTNVWKATQGAPPGGPLATLATGKVLLVSGSSPQLYDPSTNDWTPTGSLQQTNLVEGTTLTRLLNGQALAAGGEIETRISHGYETRTIISTTASAELYTP